ncbi:MAG: hypothetical protein ISS82_04640 [Nanoarchaeota archaeon]|nr:hypothetical protein [Nanoarchaeota archaeon]
MVRRGHVLICAMSADDYRRYIGAIRSFFSRHVRVDIERKRNKKGEKIVEIWSPYPEVVKPAVEKVLRGK